jgi:hypothetical protein
MHVPLCATQLPVVCLLQGHLHLLLLTVSHLQCCCLLKAHCLCLYGCTVTCQWLKTTLSSWQGLLGLLLVLRVLLLRVLVWAPAGALLLLLPRSALSACPEKPSSPETQQGEPRPGMLLSTCIPTYLHCRTTELLQSHHAATAQLHVNS